MSFGRKIEQRSVTPNLGPQERIAYHGYLRPFLQTVSSRYDFGDYVGHEIKQNGYEDFNLVLDTEKEGPVFLKCFAGGKDGRSREDCLSYLHVIQNARNVGKVRTPFLYRNNKGNVLTTVRAGGSTVYLCTMQYLDGGNIWENRKKKPLTSEDQLELIRQAARINLVNFDPGGKTDTWAIPNIGEKYKLNKERVGLAERPIIEKLIDQLDEEKEDVESLSRALVHGDIRSTNVMRNGNEPVYIIDFSVARWYPRIMEMAVLCCDILFDANAPQDFTEKYEWALSEYEKAGIKLTPEELRLLPLFVRLAHAANIVGGSSADATDSISKEEAKYWLEIGKTGMHFTVDSWMS